MYKDIKTGDMLAGMWGYEQTNITYYKVLKRTKTTVLLQEWEQKVVEQTDYLAELVVAGDAPAKEQDHYIDENGDFKTRIIDAKPFRRRVMVEVSSNDETEFVRTKSYMWAYPVDPTAKLRQTHYH